VGQLILARHALPEIDPDRPARTWALSEAGRLSCIALAEKLAAYDLAAVVTSVEPKARETGEIVAGRLSLPVETAIGLHEHERETVGWLGREQFETSVADLFARPGVLVFGEETADQAHRRFAAAVREALDQHPAGNVAIVTHGTVMSLFVARANGLDPLPFWRQLGMPAFAVLSRPESQLLEIVENVEGPP
jgi:broad specificity phosphatase PhoE